MYQCDTYNEMNPPTNDPGYLRRSSAGVYAAMAAADPQAVWLLQGWFLEHDEFWKAPQARAYLGGVPRGKMIVLDLYTDKEPLWAKTASFYGHQFIYCTLLNFGGQQGIVGNLTAVEVGLAAALAAPNSSIAGVGITMEGIWTNYAVFERQLALSWDTGGAAAPASESPPAPGLLPAWFARFGRRRYGAVSAPSAVAAWSLLGRTIYAGHGGGFGSTISTLPSLVEGMECSIPAQSPNPPAPQGFHRRHPQDGRWGGCPPPLAKQL